MLYAIRLFTHLSRFPPKLSLLDDTLHAGIFPEASSYIVCMIWNT